MSMVEEIRYNDTALGYIKDGEEEFIENCDRSMLVAKRMLGGDNRKTIALQKIGRDFSQPISLNLILYQLKEKDKNGCKTQLFARMPGQR